MAPTHDLPLKFARNPGFWFPEVRTFQLPPTYAYLSFNNMFYIFVGFKSAKTYITKQKYIYYFQLSTPLLAFSSKYPQLVDTFIPLTDLSDDFHKA